MAAVEEAIFWRMLQTALERVSGPVIAVVVQAVTFGLLHVAGVPTAIMAGTLGLLPKVTRWRTRGVAGALPRTRRRRREHLLPPLR